jgi:hypothetical protein
MKLRKKITRRLFFTSPLVLLSVGSSALLGAPTAASAFTVTDLGATIAADIAPSGACFRAASINDNGKVAICGINVSQNLAYLTPPGSWLNPLAGDQYSYSLALDNAASPNVVGISLMSTASTIVYHPVKWASGGSTPT